MPTCTYAHISTYLPTHAYTCTYMNHNIPMYLYTYILYTCIPIYIHMCGYLHVYLHIYTYTYAPMPRLIPIPVPTYTYPYLPVPTYITIIYPHTYPPTYLPSYRPKALYLQRNMHACIHTYIYTDLHTYYEHTNKDAYTHIHTYMHTYIHTDTTPMCVVCVNLLALLPVWKNTFAQLYGMRRLLLFGISCGHHPIAWLSRPHLKTKGPRPSSESVLQTEYGFLLLHNSPPGS